jgi:hypothetical protein
MKSIVCWKCKLPQMKYRYEKHSRTCEGKENKEVSSSVSDVGAAFGNNTAAIVGGVGSVVGNDEEEESEEDDNETGEDENDKEEESEEEDNETGEDGENAEYKDKEAIFEERRLGKVRESGEDPDLLSALYLFYKQGRSLYTDSKSFAPVKKRKTIDGVAFQEVLVSKVQANSSPLHSLHKRWFRTRY